MSNKIEPVQFISVELLFPTWLNARQILDKFITIATHLEAVLSEEEPDQVIIQPIGLNCLENMPDDLRPTLNEVLDKTYADYIPVKAMAEKFVDLKLTKENLRIMTQELWRYEHSLCLKGYVPYQYRLLHGLGITGVNEVQKGLLRGITDGKSY